MRGGAGWKAGRLVKLGAVNADVDNGDRHRLAVGTIQSTVVLRRGWVA